MKLTKKLASLALVLLMLCAMTTNVFAVGEGSISIDKVQFKADNSAPIAKYSIYRMLDLVTHNNAEGKYSYKVMPEWADFFTDNSTDPMSDALDFVDVTGDGYVSWKKTVPEDDATVAKFAALALKYAQDENISPLLTSDPADYPAGHNPATDPIVTVTPPSSGEDYGKILYEQLPLGYYLVDSTMGALCGLTTTSTHGEITAKNFAPKLEKHVQEDSYLPPDSTEFNPDIGWHDSNTAQLGQTVYFRATIDVLAGAENYVLHDKMSDGLEFIEVIKVTHIQPGSSIHTADPSKYTVVTGGSLAHSDCTFEVKFSEEFCNDLAANDKIYVYYSAKLTSAAHIGESDPDTNDAWLEFGDENYTVPDSTDTFTYGIDLVKTDDQNKLLDGASFKIYESDAADATPMKFVEVASGKYRLATVEDADSITVTELPVVGGIIRINGFDNGTYYLEEIDYPEGYNPITTKQPFTISSANLYATLNSSGTHYVGGPAVPVVNRTGSMLPTTGGMGTTIFYISGAALALGAVVLLVTKKRMGAGE